MEKKEENSMSLPQEKIPETTGIDRPPFHFLDKKFIYPMLFIILAIFFAFGVYSYITFDSGTGDYETNSRRFTLESTDSGNTAQELAEAEPLPAYKTPVEIRSLALNEGNPNRCEEMRTGLERDNCYRFVALSFANPEICRNMYENGDDLSPVKCIIEIAIRQQNLLYCLDVDSVRTEFTSDEYTTDNCYKEYAEAYNSPEICVNIIDTSLAAECEESASSGAEI